MRPRRADAEKVWERGEENMENIYLEATQHVEESRTKPLIMYWLNYQFIGRPRINIRNNRNSHGTDTLRHGNLMPARDFSTTSLRIDANGVTPIPPPTMMLTS